MDVLWKLQPSTAAKHRLYQRYLGAWWPKLLQPGTNGWRRSRVTYVDAFAGPGVYEDGEEGSPVFVLRQLLEHRAAEAMNLTPERVRLVFVERERTRVDRLRLELHDRFGPVDRLPVRVEVRHGEAGRVTLPILDELRAWDHPIIAIFDSWGNVNVPLPVVERIAHNRSSEVIVTFGPNWFSRRADEDPEQLDSVFGGRDHWQAGDASLSSRDRWQAWLQTYQAALRRAGFRYPLSFEVVPRTGQPFYLVFGTGHIEGVNAMKDAMWHVDGEDGMSFRDPRAESAPTFVQESLFELPDPRRLELLSLVLGRLSRGPTVVEDLREWLLIETSRWRKKDATDAIGELRDGGQVTVEPPGRVTRRSVVRLRS